MPKKLCAISCCILVQCVIGKSALAGLPDGSWWPIRITSFAGYIHFCGSSGGGEIVAERADGTVISKGKRNTGNLWVTGLEIIDGEEQNMANAEINPRIGRGNALIVGKLAPSSTNGKWFSWQELTLSVADGDRGQGIGIGTGALLGNLMLFSTAAVEKDVVSPCGPAYSVPLIGSIISLV